MKVPQISIVIPVINEEGNVPVMVERIKAALIKHPDYQILFVNDGSSDKTLAAIKAARKADQRVNYISFSKNFGHQNALRAGLEHADGECVISMDGDLQHPPEMLPQLIAKWQEGYDIVYTVRAEQGKVPIFKKIMSNAFYFVTNLLVDTRIERGAADFRLLDQKVVKAIRQYHEVGIFYRGIIPTLGFKKFAISFEPHQRLHGTPTYDLKRNVKMATDGITGFSTVPLRISTYLGLICALFAFIYGAYAVIVRLLGATVEGWTSVVFAVTFIGGIQLVMIGILGEYIGKLFFEIKARPSYIVEESSLDDLTKP